MSLPGALNPNVGRKVKYYHTDAPAEPYISTVVYVCRSGELVVDLVLETDTGNLCLAIISPPGPNSYHKTVYV